MNPIITERLRISEFTFADAGFIVRLLNTEGWLKNIGDRGVRNTEDAENYLSNGPMKTYETQGFGFYKVSLFEGGEDIGMCGLVKREALDDVDIGYALHPEFEGKGYAYEASSAMMRYAKEVLHLKRLVAITTKENVRSQHLLAKLGMYFEKMQYMPKDDEELMLFAKNL